jgi:hypothetical protein
MSKTNRDKRRNKQRFKKFDSFPVNEQMADALQKQLESFRRKFGRDPGPNDPVFFDPDADEPRPVDNMKVKAAMLEAAHKAGLRKATVDFIEQNYDNDASFECLECGTEIIAWALAHPICPECNHESMKRKLVVAK